MIKQTLTFSAAAMLMLSVSTTAPAQEAPTSQPDAAATITEHNDAVCREKAIEGNDGARECTMDQQTAQSAPGQDVEESPSAVAGALDAHPDHLAQPMPEGQIAHGDENADQADELAQTGPDAMTSGDAELQGGPSAEDPLPPMGGDIPLTGNNQ
jgi:hypothetical protein